MSFGGSETQDRGHANAQNSRLAPPTPIPASANVRRREAAAIKAAPAAAESSRSPGVIASLSILPSLGEIQAFEPAGGISKVFHPHTRAIHLAQKEIA
jgi:hypothetical protein